MLTLKQYDDGRHRWVMACLLTNTSTTNPSSKAVANVVLLVVCSLFSNVLNSTFTTDNGLHCHRVPFLSRFYGENTRVARYLSPFCTPNHYLHHTQNVPHFNFMFVLSHFFVTKTPTTNPSYKAAVKLFRWSVSFLKCFQFDIHN